MLWWFMLIFNLKEISNHLGDKIYGRVCWGRPMLNVSASIPWAGVLDCTKGNKTNKRAKTMRTNIHVSLFSDFESSLASCSRSSHHAFLVMMMIPQNGSQNNPPHFSFFFYQVCAHSSKTNNTDCLFVVRTGVSHGLAGSCLSDLCTLFNSSWRKYGGPVGRTDEVSVQWRSSSF